MEHPQAGFVTLLFRRLDRRGRGADASALLYEGGKLGIMARRGGRQEMIGCNRHEFRAEQRVGPCSVDFEFVQPRFARQRARRGWVDRKSHQQSLGAADPVALHQPHFFRPTLQTVQRIEQLFGVIGDLEEPLREFTLLDDRAGTPAAAVHDLLIGEHGVVYRVPIDFGFLAVTSPAARKSRNSFC